MKRENNWSHRKELQLRDIALGKKRPESTMMTYSMDEEKNKRL